jgi:hypothetical protein
MMAKQPQDAVMMSTVTLRNCRTDTEMDNRRESLVNSWVAVSLIGFLMGFHMMWNDWYHVGWFVVTGLIALVSLKWTIQWPLLTQNKVIQWGAIFLGWMTVRSLFSAPYLNSATPWEVGNWLLGAVSLAALVVLLWAATENPLTLQKAGLYAGLAAAFTAVISFTLFYFILPGHEIGERLQNWFIYGGLHPVGTGLRYGFAAMWLACLYGQMQVRKERLLIILSLIILYAAVFLTLSRGALLALAVGHAALFLGGGWLRSRLVCGLFLAVMVTMQLCAPLVKASMEKSHASSSDSPALMQGPVLDKNPAKEFWQRRDNGRFMLYKAAWQTLDDRSSKIIGIGQWGTDARWRSHVSWAPEHLHSIFLATFIHGGTIGLFLLLALILKGFQSAKDVAFLGDPTWLALLAYGCAGLIFDGQTLCSLTSVPRIEPLLIWLPIVASSAIRQRGL